MTVYYVLAEYGDLDSYNNFTFNTDSGYGGWFNPSNVRASFSNNGTNSAVADTYSWFKGPAFSATNLWLHFRLRCTDISWWTNRADTSNLANQSMIKIMAGGTKRLRVIVTGTNTIQLDKWNGSSWDTLATYTTVYGQQDFYSSGQHYYDIHAPVGPSVNVEVYLDNNVILAASGVDTTFGGTVTAFDDVYFSGPSGYGVTTHYSEILAADWNTIGAKVLVRQPDANGSHAEWANGDYTQVDEVLGGTDYATSATADQRVDWSMGSFPALASNEVIPYVKLNAVVNRDLVGPQNMNFYVARNGTDYHSTDQTLPLVQATRTQLYLTDPATSDVWTVANLNASTFGIRSRT